MHTPTPKDLARAAAIRKAEQQALELSLARLKDAAETGSLNRCWRKRDSK